MNARWQNAPDRCSARTGLRGHVLAVAITMLMVVAALGADVTLCPLAGLLGIPCPSCGITRASLALLAGDLQRAHSIHPGVLPIWAYLAVAVMTRRFQARRAIVGKLGAALLVVMVALWLVRFAGALGGPVSVERWWPR